MPQYINRIEVAEKKSVSTPLLVTDEVMQGIAFRAILTSGEYPDNMREWQKLTPADQTWGNWKTKFLLVYSSKELSDKAMGAVRKPFGGQAIAQALPQQVQPQVTNQMFNMLSGYLDNTTAAANTTGRVTELADLATSMSILVDTNAAQSK